jgi:hypothetical protein
VAPKFLPYLLSQGLYIFSLLAIAKNHYGRDFINLSQDATCTPLLDRQPLLFGAQPAIEWLAVNKNGDAPLLMHRRGYARPCAVFTSKTTS